MRCVLVSLLFCLGFITYTVSGSVYRGKRQDETTVKPGTISKKICNSYPKLDKKKREARRISFTTSIYTNLPHMAAIGFGDKHIKWLCGGTLISEKFVLTAAHCKGTYLEGDAKWVRLGASELSSEKNQTTIQDFSILRFISHPDYKKPVKYNDIALVELNGKVKFTNDVSPACLQTEKKVDEFGLSVAAWENEYFGTGTRQLANFFMDYVPNEECNKVYNKTRISQLYKGVDDEIQICAQSSDRDIFCNGNSGSPFQVFDEHDIFTVVGVISFSNPCAVSSPMVATRVSHYIPWIESVVWPNETQ